MRVAVFSAKPYDERFLGAAGGDHELIYFEARLGRRTAPLAAGFPAVCVFVNDVVDADVLSTLAAGGTGLVATRSAGFNHIDLAAADRMGITVARVPAYSPDAVAEHTVALILTLDRKIHRAHSRVREGNFALEGLLGFDLARRTVGVVGTGRIGTRTAAILAGFGCTLLGYDPYPSAAAEAVGVRYVPLEQLLATADIITLHLPLTPDTHHLIDAAALASMKPGAMLINTSRGALIDTAAAVEALKNGQLGNLGLDVYEEEGDLFFEDLSNQVITDDVFSRLLTFPNVVVTGHQAFFTEEALRAIADTTIANFDAFAAGVPSGNEVSPAAVTG